MKFFNILFLGLFFINGLWAQSEEKAEKMAVVNNFSPKEKIKFTFETIDENGKIKGTKGKTPLKIELCILSRQVAYEEIMLLEPTLKFSSKTDCPRDYWVMETSLSGKNWQEKLMKLASLNTVVEIRKAN
jgi:hypothetical protein